MIHELRLNSSRSAGSPHKMYGESYGAEGLQDSFTPVQSYHGAPLTGQFSQSTSFRYLTSFISDINFQIRERKNKRLKVEKDGPDWRSSEGGSGREREQRCRYILLA